MIPNKSPRARSPPTSSRDPKRPRLDATFSAGRPRRSRTSNVSMNQGQGRHQGSSPGPSIHTPGHTIDPYPPHQQWPTSSGALSPDPNAPGPSGHYSQGGDYFAATRTTSVPVAMAISKPVPAPRASKPSYSSSESSSLSSTPFTSVSPVASFSSDTSAATHYSSTTSISGDHPYDVFTSQLAKRPGETAGPGFQLRLDSPEKQGSPSHALVAQAGRSSPGWVDDVYARRATEQSHEPSAPATEMLPWQGSDHLDPNLVYEYDASLPSPLLRGQPAGGDQASVQRSSPHQPTTHASTDPNTITVTSVASSQRGLVAPSLPPPLVLLPDPSPLDVRSLRMPSATAPPQTLPPLTPFSVNPFASTLARDAMLMYAHRIYDAPTNPLPSGLSPMPVSQPSVDPTSPDHAYTRQLLPLLLTLRNLHPRHLPTLLLLGCVLYAVGDFNGSLTLNSEILQVDPTYVEAMSNIGTTLRALGKTQEAEAWWWKAIRLRPIYWDAMDNLLGVLCIQPNERLPNADQTPPRYEDALHVCEFVESKVLGPGGELLMDVPPAHRHRVQNLLYTNGSLRYVMDRPDARSSAISHHFKALDFLMRPVLPRNDKEQYEAVDVVIAVCVAGLLASAGPSTPLAAELAIALGISDASRFSARMLEPSFDILQAVHNAGPRLTETLLRMGGGILPMTLLLPDQVSRLPSLLFPSSDGVLPGLCSRTSEQALETPPDAPLARRMTSTVLLTLARIFQHIPSTSQPTLPGRGSAVRASTSLVLLFYYLALAIHPSPATCNNMGIILSNVSGSTLTSDSHGHQEVVNGQVLASAYYRKGLSQDSAHPHLLTNLGSLLKDQGRLDEAIRTYAKAIQVKPDFDVALANMGNAIKDTGRPQESIIFYRRAVEANPDFQEAVCGLANALSAVCDWRDRGGIPGEPYVDKDGRISVSPQRGWLNKVIDICDEQLLAAYSYGVGVVQSHNSLDAWLMMLEDAFGRPFRQEQRKRWTKVFKRYYTPFDRQEKKINEGGMIIKFMEYVVGVTQRRWYIDAYGQRTHVSSNSGPPPSPAYQRLADHPLQKYQRPRIPLKVSLGLPPVPSVLPFHTFTYPLSSRTTRLMSYRNALRISYMTQTQSWLPAHVYPPPPPLPDKIKVGYVSNDLNNHPLAHLMQSVFGFHNRTKFEIYVYATCSSDASRYRHKIEHESQHFVDVSTWSTREVVERIVMDGIQLLVNLGGYTKGARNDIFAARPSPVQLQFMGFAGTLAAGWCDYLVSDVISCPPDTCLWDRWRERKEQGEETSRASLATPPTTQAYTESSVLLAGIGMQDHFIQLDLEMDIDSDGDPESLSEDWMYTEHMIYMPHTFFVTDHKQSAEKSVLVEDSTPSSLWKEEENRRFSMRREVFPDLPAETVIFANFNQLYKIDPPIFAAWLRILARVPNSVLWLLRFPAAGEEHILRTAKLWAGSEVASRVVFTEVAPKEEHLRRARVADLVLDTVDCNAHTIAADVLWAGTPIITWPKHRTKMCSRVGASIASATGFGHEMVVDSLEEYESRAIRYADSVSYFSVGDGLELQRRGKGLLMELRRNLYLSREDMPLFDTRRWTRNLEEGLTEAWRRWVAGTSFENSDEWEACDGPEKQSGSIWVRDDKSA